MTDEEFTHQIEVVSEAFKGQLDDFYKVVGMLVVGRLFGWRVMRLVSARPTWRYAIKLFGDPKLMMPERGRLAHKSLGLKAVDAVDDYWKVIQGVIKFSKEERSEVV